MRSGRLTMRMAVMAVMAAGASAMAGDLSQPGPYGAGFTTVTVTRDAGLGSGTFTALLYYPATGSGSGAAFDPSGGPYPAVSFGHGFFQATTQYDDPMAHLATHGYFVIASNSETGLFPNHQQLANDLRSSLSWLEQQNASPASAYFGDVRTDAMGMSGHSMGGGCAIVAAAADARVRALAPLAPAETNVSAIGAAATLGMPVVFICGTQDTIVPTGSNGQLMYNAAPRARQLVSIVGGFHCGFTDAGSIGCDSGSITRSAQQAITRRLMVEWFNLYLKGSSDWRPVWGPESASTPEVQRTADARATLTPSTQTGFGTAGQLAFGPLQLRNLRAESMVYRLSIEEQSWSMFVEPGALSLGAGDPASVGTIAQVPSGSSLGDFDEVVVSAAATDGASGQGQIGGTRVWARVRFEVNALPPPCAGDANGDGRVDAADLSVLLGSFQQSVAPGSGADFNGDGRVDAADLSVLLGRFGSSC